MAYIIAEIGNNHEGNIQKAYEMILEARACGVDAVKFQAGTAVGFARTPADIPKYKKYVLSMPDFISLKNYANALGLKAFYSIWCEDYEMLRSLEDFHKIPARQCKNKLIKTLDNFNTLISIPYEGSKNSYKSRVKELKAIMKNSIPMFCISEYPTIMPNLEKIEIIRNVFGDGRPIGYSDHCIGIDACIAAVKLYGVKYIEKHFTLDKKTVGLRDHALSADPDDMKKLVSEIGGIK